MNSFKLTIKNRLALLIAIVAFFAVALFISAINQLKKVKDYQQLSKTALNLANARNTIDSLENVFRLHADFDVNFYTTGQSNRIERIISFAVQQQNVLKRLVNNYYIATNKQIHTKSNLIVSELNNYMLSLNEYKLFLYKKGHGEYGTIGEINLILNKTSATAKLNSLTAINNKINIINELKIRYLQTIDPVIANRVRLETEEVKTMAILAAGQQKVTLVTSLQRLQILFEEIFELDKKIGYTVNDGILGKMKTIKDMYVLDGNELHSLISAKLHNAVVWGFIWLSVFSILLIIALILLYVQVFRYIHKPINRIILYLTDLVQGKLPDPLKFKFHDEISEMAVFLNKFVESLKTKAEFATQIGEGKLNSHYQPLSNDDILGNALINMEKSLQKAEMEDQKYKDEEKKRIWANEGVARFGEILRLHNNDLNKLSDEIIQNLVSYLNASQGGLFYINDDAHDNIHLEMVAAFAYDRKKYINKKIMLGEGLVGTVALEKAKVFITDVPENYLTISSGLGESIPRSILLVPLKLEDEILGVIEMASFNIFEPHEIDFVEKIGQTIASTITGVKINARTAKLLEQSQKQAEEMAEQEEEMRQNMEELRTTQEDFNRRESEITNILNAINTTALVLFYDMDARIIDVNSKLLELLSSKREDVVGRNHSELSSLGRTPDEYQKFWDKLRNALAVSHVEKIRLPNGKELWLNQTFTPITDRTGIPIKVICISTNITEIKAHETELLEKTKQLEYVSRELSYIITAIDDNLLRCTYSPEGRILEVNANYCELIGHSQSELIGKMHIAFLKDDEKISFERIWNDVIKFISYNGIFMITGNNNKIYKLLLNFIPVKDNSGILAKVYLIARNISDDTI